MSFKHFIHGTRKHCFSILTTAVITASAAGSFSSLASVAPDTSSNAAAMNVQAPEQSVHGAEVTTEQDNILNGAEIRLIEPVGTAQNLSVVMKTVDGHVIVVDGGRDEDADALVSEINSLGGTVSLWLVTHPHNDHIGALTEILNRNPMPINIEQIAYRFLPNEQYEQGETMGRMENLTAFQEALTHIDQKKQMQVTRGQVLTAGDASVYVLNDPFYCAGNTMNNSSIAYRVEMGGKKIIFLGDMGREAGNNLVEICPPWELKADIVQMAHHGNHGVGKNVYEVIRPEICLWPTTSWLWNNEKDGVAGAGSYDTPIIRQWMRELGAKRFIISKDGTQTLR